METPGKIVRLAIEVASSDGFETTVVGPENPGNVVRRRISIFDERGE
jgi:hypothetical protein